MMKFKAILPICILAVLTLFSCKKDDSAPIFDLFEVNGVSGTTNNNFRGEHSMGSSLTIEVGVSDDSELASYEVIQENAKTPVVKFGDLEGTDGSFTLAYTVDSTLLADDTRLMVGDSAKFTFLVEDARGQSETKTYAFKISN